MRPRSPHLRPLPRLALALIVAAALPATAIVFAEDKKPAPEPVRAEEDAAAEMLGIAEKANPAPAFKAEAAVKAVRVEGAAVKAVKVEEDAAAEMLGIATKAAEEGQAAKAAVVANGPEVDDNALQPLIQQFTPQVRPVVRSELHLIAAACNPSPSQKVALKLAGDRLLKEATREYAVFQLKIRNGKWNGNSPQPDPSKSIYEGLDAAVKEILTPEQADLYKKEAGARAAHFQSVAILNLVSSLDRELDLNSDQRAEIVDSLAANWDPRWCTSLQTFLYDNNSFPSIPDPLVVPFLDPSQKAAWVKKPKGNQNYWNATGFMGDISLDEDENPADGAEAKPPSGDDPK